MRSEREPEIRALLDRGRRFILDTSAVVAYLHGEPGLESLDLAMEACEIPFVALTELYYITWLKAGKARADTAYGLVKAWHLPLLIPDERVILAAGRLKAVYSLGIADSYVAAFARVHNHVLLTRDTGYAVLKEEVDLIQL